jgi:hypothetical protein
VNNDQHNCSIVFANNGAEPDWDAYAAAEAALDNGVQADVVNAIVRDVCELDYPGEFDEEKMLSVTVDDLRLICARNIEALTHSAQAAQGSADYIAKLRSTLCAISTTLDDAELRSAAREAYDLPVPVAAQGSGVQADVVIGAGDPMAFFAAFCDREGYPSDGEMDEALKAAFYEGIKYCAARPAPSAAPAGEYRTCCDHPDCPTCAGRGGFYRMGAAPAQVAQGEPVRYELRMRAPNGHFGQWHEVEDITFQKFSDNPDIGDGFAYEARALGVLASPAAPTQPQHANMAALDVLAERGRQIEREGYDHENDDVHVMGELGAYAAFYAMPPAVREWPAAETGYGETWGDAIVPTDWTAPKPGDRRDELVKAGALILAEIERIDRAAPGLGGQHD